VAKLRIAVGLLVIISLLLVAEMPMHPRLSAQSRVATESNADSTRYMGSVSCRKCHEKFYQLWSTSHHGLAMQPYSADFARTQLTPQTAEIAVGPYRYMADVGGEAGWIVEQGAEGEKRFPIQHVMGERTSTIS